jgi:ABC-type glycerol-3-phosphate transport system permease component
VAPVSAVSTPARSHAMPRSARRNSAGRQTAVVARKTGFFVVLAVFVLASLFPFYWIVVTSLKTQAQIAKGTTSLLPGTVTFSNYVDDFTQQDFITPLLNSILVAACVTLISVILATMAGYALSKTRIRGKTAILGFILLGAFFPLLAMVGPLFILYRHIGLLNTYPGLIIACLIYTLPLATWLLTNYFAQIPKELEEAAVMDGTSRIQALYKVIMPVAMPGVFTVTILSFILAWNDFTFALSFMESPSKYTAPLAIVDLVPTGANAQYQTFYNLTDAAVVIISLPIALLVIFAQRRIISGLTAGALK